MIYPEGCFRKGNRCFEDDFGQPGDREGLSAGVKTPSLLGQLLARLKPCPFAQSTAESCGVVFARGIGGLRMIFSWPGECRGRPAGVKTRSPFEQCAARLNRLRKKAWFWAKLGKSIPQGLKPLLI